MDINGEVSKKLSTVDLLINDIHKSVYGDDVVDGSKLLTTATNNLYKTIDQISNKYGNNLDHNLDIEKLYDKLRDKNLIPKEDNLFELFGGLDSKSVNISPDINRQIRLLDFQYDMICKYMSKLEEVVNLKKDTILSSDSMNKEFINIASDHMGETADKFSDNALRVKNKYRFSEFIDTSVYRVIKYGEDFILNIPEYIGIQRLLDEKNKGNLFTSSKRIVKEGGIVSNKPNISTRYNIKGSNLNLNLNINKSGVPASVIKEHYAILNNKKYGVKSLKESFMESVSITTIDNTNNELESINNKFNTNGFYNHKDSKKEEEKIKEYGGAILRRLDRDKIILRYIGDVCIGYIYIEINDNNARDSYTLAMQNTINRSSMASSQYNRQNDDEESLKLIASRISDAITAEFINDNTEYGQEIYSILKANSILNKSDVDVDVTFYSASDIHHLYFEQCPITHRGISSLFKALIPATFYTLLRLTATMAYFSRGQDKRVYYAEQNVDKNVYNTLLNVYAQLQMGNMGVREVESIQSVINIVGRYNDHLIPTNADGQPPVRIEVLEGQRIEIPQELLDGYEEEAVNSTDVPLELVNASLSVDFAIRYTMTNTKFLRKAFKLQFILQEQLTQLFTSLYNYEYLTNESNISVILPPPAFLALSNTNQLIENVKSYCQQIADQEYPEDGPEKQLFIKYFIRSHISTYVNVKLIDSIKEKVKLEVTLKMNNPETNQDEYY